MTALGSNFSVGFRHIDIFALNASNTPAGSSDSSGLPYEGIHYESARALNVTYPKPRQIIQAGDDGVEALQVLPPNSEVLTAELMVGMANFDAIASVAGVKLITLGTSKMLSMATDMQGFEPYFGILAYNQGSGWPGGAQSWNWYMLPMTRVIATMPSFADTVQNITLHLSPQIVTSQLWGVALTAAVNGATRHQALWGVSVNRPRIASWVADGSNNTFLFNTLYPAVDAASVIGFVNGVLAAGVATVNGFTPTTPTSSNDKVDVWYEY
jgi:hypothetical protein